jgi:hypothetical protein
MFPEWLDTDTSESIVKDYGIFWGIENCENESGENPSAVFTSYLQIELALARFFHWDSEP